MPLLDRARVLLPLLLAIVDWHQRQSGPRPLRPWEEDALRLAEQCSSACVPCECEPPAAGADDPPPAAVDEPGPPATGWSTAAVLEVASAAFSLGWAAHRRAIQETELAPPRRLARPDGAARA